MHVLCFGAGAIGSLVGGRLALSGITVTVLARRSHVAAIRTWGLILETPTERLTCKRIDSITSLDDLSGLPDLVILTVKAYDTLEALATLHGVLGDYTPVVSLQNGVGNEELIAAAVGPDRTYAGTITISASRPRPGVVRQNTAVGGIALAPVGSGERLEEFVAVLRGAGFQTERHPDFRAMKWSKLLLNIFTNATSAILEIPPLAIIDDPRLYEIERAAFREARQVMRALGLHTVALPGYPVPLLQAAALAPAGLVRPILRRYVRRGRGEAMPSLWEDLRRGRPQSEVEVLNGAVAREGIRLGIATPVNAALTDVVLGLANGRLDSQEFRGRPEALLARVEGATAG